MTEAPTLGASRPRTGRARAVRYGPPVAAIVVYTVVAVVAYWPVEPFSRTQLLGCACSDPAQETWFLAWVAYALRHGSNPFFSTLLNYPHGVNLALNTTMPLLGVLASPLTWARGPVAAFNAMMRLSFVLSATSMLFVVRRYARWWPAAFLAGLLYGFSPYMTGEGFGHLFLTFVPLPPLILATAYELVRRTERPRLRRGLLLGALCAAQYFISTEVLVTTGVCAAAVAVVALARHPVGAWEHVRRAAAAVGAAAALLVALVAYPTWYFLRGPQHVVGPPHSVANLAPLKADLLSFVVPTMNQRLGPAHLIAVGTSFGAGDRPENGVYLGIPLVLLLGWLLGRYRRDERVVLAGVLAGSAMLLALGTPLLVDGHDSGIPLPFDVLLHLPLLKGVTALRFGLFEQLGAALLLGLGLGHWRGAVPDGPAVGGAEADGGSGLERDAGGNAPTGGSRRRWWRPGLVAAAGAVALVPLLPRYPYPSQSTGLPTFVTTTAVEAVPPQSVMLTYPWDIDPLNEPMLWQAESGMRFAIFGGQASTPGPGGAATSAVADLPPGVVQQLFAAGLGSTAAGPAPPLPAFDAATLQAIVDFCRRYQVSTIALEPQGAAPGTVVRYLTAALGAAPKANGGVDVWSDVPALLASHAATSAG